jgi:hypothetical protein
MGHATITFMEIYASKVISRKTASLTFFFGLLILTLEIFLLPVAFLTPSSLSHKAVLIVTLFTGLFFTWLGRRSIRRLFLAKYNRLKDKPLIIQGESVQLLFDPKKRTITLTDHGKEQIYKLDEVILTLHRPLPGLIRNYFVVRVTSLTQAHVIKVHDHKNAFNAPIDPGHNPKTAGRLLSYSWQTHSKLSNIVHWCRVNNIDGLKKPRFYVDK